MQVGDVGLKEMQSIWERNRIAGAPRSPDLLQLIDVVSRMGVDQASAVVLQEGEDVERVKSLVRRAAKILEKTVTVVSDVDRPRVCFSIRSDSATPAGDVA